LSRRLISVDRPASAVVANATASFSSLSPAILVGDFSLVPGFPGECAQMVFHEHEDDREINESVARLLGESVAVVRRRGFHVIDTARQDDEPDVVDMAELTGGLDWDHGLEPRVYIRCGRRKRRAA
jgi:hypothetical protein